MLLNETIVFGLKLIKINWPLQLNTLTLNECVQARIVPASF